MSPPKPENTSLSEKLAARKKGQSWKDKIGNISSPKETKTTPSNDRKRPRSDDVSFKTFKKVKVNCKL